MKTIAFLMILLSGISAYCQENVPFLSETPKIEGIIDDQLRNELKTFPDIHKSSDSLKDIMTGYFIGYNSEFLYIYIEAAADKIIYRDRAYQNGDGFHLTIAKPKTDGSPADEFYVFGFSPSKDWTNKIRWYHNINLSMSRLPADVLFESAENNGTISFELLIPWMTVKPYHPWISQSIGFNLCFVKAINEHDKIYYFITTDERMQSEQSKREYVTMTFEKPTVEGKIFASPKKFNISTDQDLEVNFTGFFLKPTHNTVSIEVLNENDEKIFSTYVDLHFTQGLSTISKVIHSEQLTEGCYDLKVSINNDLLCENLITVIEKPDFSYYRYILTHNRSRIKEGSYNTVQFYINELENEINNLRYYESSKSIVNKSSELRKMMLDIESNKDPLGNMTGVYRRAFLSATDNSFNPYSIYVPEDYSPDKVYPLLVYLHGSGEDDRALLRTSFIKEGYIILAPNGKGTSNCFATTEAQLDIQESIADVKNNFSIDSKRVVLSGFSMGGYGVYRTYYQNPEMFSSIAIISGHPNLASKWGFENPIDFLDEDKLKVFSSVPIFIYHGMNDLNCPFNLTNNLVNIIKKYNNNVVFVSDESAGHGGMKPEIQQEYFNWLLQQKKSQ